MSIVGFYVTVRKSKIIKFAGLLVDLEIISGLQWLRRTNTTCSFSYIHCIFEVLIYVYICGRGWNLEGEYERRKRFKEGERGIRTLDNKMKRAEITDSKWVQSGHGVEEESWTKVSTKQNMDKNSIMKPTTFMVIKDKLKITLNTL